MKLAQAQRVAASYWQGHAYVPLYEPSEAVAMRARREVTPGQLAALAAGRALIGTSPCGDCGTRIDSQLLSRAGLCFDCSMKAAREEREHERRAVCDSAAAWLRSSPLFLDTETTGLDTQAEIIEIAILDAAGTVLLDSLVKPVGPIPPEASAVHGITAQDVVDAPTWRDIGKRVADIISERLVIAHSADFDSRMMRQSCELHGLATPAFSIGCSMSLLLDLNGGRRPNLLVAAAMAGVVPSSVARHRACTDAELCRQIVVALSVLSQSAPDGHYDQPLHT